jgi:hypothetical protein
VSIKLGILNGFRKGPDSYELYIDACKDLGVEYEVVDIISEHWLDNVRNSSCAAFLARPTPYYVPWKIMFDERLYHIERSLGRIVYPSYKELVMYENKRQMAYFLQINNIAAPKTHIFYDEAEALDFAHESVYPLVFKTHLGAQARGVDILKTKRRARSLIRQVFSRGYARDIRTTLRGILKTPISIPYYFFDSEYKVIILQQYLVNCKEWRMIRIGKSYFGHQKLIKGEYHSGSGLVGWETPPRRLLDFVRTVCDIGNFWSMCVDVFEDPAGNYYVNELQSVFSSYNPSQMYVDGKPGRFLYNSVTDQWEFEEGLFNRNGSNNLRVEHLIEILAANAVATVKAQPQA